jgi:hypothetical protein
VRISRAPFAAAAVLVSAGLTASLVIVACASDPRSGTPTTTTRPTPTTSAGGSTTSTTSSTPPVEVPRYVDENGFDDHTVPRLDTMADVMAMARPGVHGQMAVKFTIPSFEQVGGLRVHWMDSNFFGLHDEWYWFRLLNGQQVPAMDVAPVQGPRFNTIAEIYRWASAQPPEQLPLDLQWNGSGEGRRLYSDAFYDTVLATNPRTYGVGALIRMPDKDGGADHWLIELEYSDKVTPAHVAGFFDRLRPTLPAEIADNLRWVIRSPAQEAVAQQMAAEQLPYHDRIVRFSELVPPGTAAVYSGGVTAGRLLFVGDGGAQLGDAKEGDIVVTERVPDWLPPVNAMMTSDPQTPLAHVNLLARNRGIPNASLSGVHDDPGVRQAARVRGYAIVVADADTVRIALITKDQYEQWVARNVAPPAFVPPVPVDDAPYVVDLTREAASGPTQAEIDALRPLIGGKSAGFLTLLAVPGLDPPPDPLAITVRSYSEHVAGLRTAIRGAISNPDFTKSARARWLTLEGPKDYATIFPTDSDAAFAEQFLAAHPVGDPLGDVLAAGGVRELIESQPMDDAALQVITSELLDRYRNYDVTAGLRFRSSSNVEDIEGFNGAGLYVSYTGYFRPELLKDENDHDKTIERAILKTWSSYWTFEAFEERRLENIEHLSGAMGITVHARFDDDLERNNGVVTFAYVRGGDEGDFTMEINAQAGAVDVTNPDPTRNDLPEVIRVERRDGTTMVERVSTSTLSPTVLDDDAVTELVAQVEAVADVWRDRLNDSLPAVQRVQTVSLDFEFKTVEQGWPKLASGNPPYPARLVLRQVRSLDPGTRALPADALGLPIPRDILVRASRIEEHDCDNVWSYVVYTDPVRSPDMGHTTEPFVVGPAPAEECPDRVVFADPSQFLRDLIAIGAAFVIVGS